MLVSNYYSSSRTCTKGRREEEGNSWKTPESNKKKLEQVVVVRKIEGKLRLRLQLCIFIIISQFSFWKKPQKNTLVKFFNSLLRVTRPLKTYVSEFKILLWSGLTPKRGDFWSFPFFWTCRQTPLWKVFLFLCLDQIKVWTSSSFGHCKNRLKMTSAGELLHKRILRALENFPHMCHWTKKKH